MASPKVADTKRGKKGLQRLPGWITASLGAERIGISRTYMWDLINAGKIDAFEVEGVGERAAFTVVRKATVAKLAKERQARLGCPQCRAVAEADGGLQGMPDPEKCTHQGADVEEDAEVLAALGV